jgi:transcriptional regulator with XRE-family HTH domain
MENPVGRFGQNVRALRLEQGWTQEELADRSGLTSVQISRVERGVREVRLTTLLRLMSALETTPGRLLDGIQ